MVECYELPESYDNPTPDQACKDGYGPQAKADAGRPSTSGPCVGFGGTHHDCRVRSRFVGTASCCPCCEDTPAGPVTDYRCGVTS
jgi:hypothetical protein